MRDGSWSSDKRGWHIWDDGTTFVLARRLPIAWDVAAETRLPDMGRRRLAHAVRQDLWRMLQRLRGFAPIVSVTRGPQGVAVRAGGAVAGRMPTDVPGRIAAMLADPATRAAWLKSAGHR
ncbi:hypothetical protein [Jannaschia donghaensis]|uniref:Uncharacterized protein n=1 Tax=Jannaschia donghaensis TaxID=420998 RepID=A0A0M6YN76_9RHOB|nr:hypothetical protein [Jannaschia donghaensis]CTQ51334.1 hypothetical protein JDO7802_03373 [Jannaschia donghaensis]